MIRITAATTAAASGGFRKRLLFLRNKNIAAVICIAAGIAFIAIGLMRGENRIVLQKAVRICLECIGIG